MAQDERTVIRHAQDAVAGSLRDYGQVLPGAVMLVGRDPETGEPLSEPRAIGMLEEHAFGSEQEMELFVGGLRAEAMRLDALAVAFLGEASAEVDDDEGPRRVALIRMEDRSGVQLMHAPIERTGPFSKAGDFVASPEAPDILEQPLLPDGSVQAAGGRKRLPVL